MQKLKPCPFCGGEGCMQIHEFVGYTDTFGVVCLDFGEWSRWDINDLKDVVAWMPLPEPYKEEEDV